VIYFYPKDDTPGCTMEALDFTDLQPEFDAAETDVVGISRDTCTSHGAFRDKYGLNVQLLADTEGEACEAYGVWREKEAHGEKRMGIVRSTFIVDKGGVIRHATLRRQAQGPCRPDPGTGPGALTRDRGRLVECSRRRPGECGGQGPRRPVARARTPVEHLLEDRVANRPRAIALRARTRRAA
jgi:peroxiredoxin